MALTTTDVITQSFVRDTVEEIVQENLVWRRVFREIGAESIESNSYTFYIENDDMGRPQIVGEGEEPPRHEGEAPEEKTVKFDKYMGELSITMEAMADGLMEMKAREVEDLARAMAEKLNQEAYEQLKGNWQTTDNDGETIGDQNGTLTFDDVVEGMKALREDDYTADLLIVDVDGYTDLMTSDDFNRATARGDEVVRNGEIGSVAGMPVVVENTHKISGGSGSDNVEGHGAVLVDTTRYGYELTRTGMTTTEYEEPSRQTEVIQVYNRKAWTTIFEEAAALIDG